MNELPRGVVLLVVGVILALLFITALSSVYVATLVALAVGALVCIVWGVMELLPEDW